MLRSSYLIIYAAAQTESRNFYARVLDSQPSLDVPGMTEFTLNGETKLGIMPCAGIQRLLGSGLPPPAKGARAELYLVVTDAASYHARALANGASELSELQPRDWGHTVAYSIDADGYVLAFAEVI